MTSVVSVSCVQQSTEAGKYPWFGLLERLPTWLICIPLAVQWLGLACRYRSLTLPAAANPSITAGGLIGEGKTEYITAMGSTARAYMAAHLAHTNHVPWSASMWEERLDEAGLSWPLIVKPNLGLCGYGVRRVDNLEQLLDYLREFPVGETVMIQAYVPYEGEAGIFYARHPQQAHGQIIGLALRFFPQVTGDGQRTLHELIQADARARRVITVARHASRLDLEHVPACGEVVRLATIGSTRVGGLYRHADHHITPALTAALDAIARDMRGFICGRFDVRFQSLEELRRGSGFIIIEVNGAGSEIINAWDPQLSLVAALAMIFRKQRLLFALGAAQRRAGITPLGIIDLARLFFRQRRLIARYPSSN